MTGMKIGRLPNGSSTSSSRMKAERKVWSMRHRSVHGRRTSPSGAATDEPLQRRKVRCALDDLARAGTGPRGSAWRTVARSRAGHRPVRSGRRVQGRPNMAVASRGRQLARRSRRRERQHDDEHGPERMGIAEGMRESAGHDRCNGDAGRRDKFRRDPRCCSAQAHRRCRRPDHVDPGTQKTRCKPLTYKGFECWWRFRDSNPGPADYDSVALTD